MSRATSLPWLRRIMGLFLGIYRYDERRELLDCRHGYRGQRRWLDASSTYGVDYGDIPARLAICPAYPANAATLNIRLLSKARV